MAPDKLQQLLHELQQQGAVITGDLRDALGVALNRLPLVSQAEFDTQAAILERTREKVARLEAQLQELEQAVQEQDNTGDK
ncbi:MULTISPECIES: accessory factor UbiK family protein [Microbulbifer]|uniref:accessory factor UbiK family protein n=1 Tax=Microbulbifer TaxID=48073 RepID=UPI001E3EF140|nr:accessory factor UbiK family protein [Microbulbifer sp. YPW16]UHQ54192.1 accessory factor UbiK family protein [Microbulbifer sp. YPW16]